MAAGEDDKKKEQGKGFAGLSSLVSDVDTTPPPAAKKTTAGTTTGAASGASRPVPQAAPPKPQSAPRQQPYKPPQQPGSNSSTGKWWIGIAVVVDFFWLIGQSNKNTSTPAPAYSPPAQSTTPNYSPPAQPQAPSRPAESRPPVGQGLTFSYDLIAYCVAEDIRMDGAKSAVDDYSDSDVNQFNAMVADYNSRCSSFRYRRGVLESVRSSIEPYRSQLRAEGMHRISGGTSSRSPSPAPTYNTKGWTEESTNSTEVGPWLNYDPPGTRYYRDANSVIFRVFPPGVRPNASAAKPFGLGDSTENPQ